MVTEKERIKEWLARVAANIEIIKSQETSNLEKLNLIQENYEVLSVLIKVSKGDAFMVGVPPISQVSHK